MSTLSTTALNALKSNPPQKVKIKVSPTDGSEFYLTEEQIVQNSCTVDRYVVSGDKISYGTACAAELNFKIRNQKFTYNGTEFDPNDIKFEGARVKVWCVVDTLPDNEKDIPMGVFTIDEQPRRLATISLTALDDMVKLDKECSLQFLPTIANVRLKLEEETGITVSTNFYNNVLKLVNGNYPKIHNCTQSEMKIPLASDTEVITWRQLMCWFAELVGGNLMINADGELDVFFFPDSAIVTIDESMRYSSDVEENDISVTGANVTLTDSTEVIIGSDSYAYSISGNKLITDTAENYSDSDSTLSIMSEMLRNNNTFFAYRPFKANMKSLPNLWPMDGVDFSKDGNKYFSVLTHVTWTLNGAMSVESAGLNSTKNGYAKTRSLTSAEKAIIERIAKSNNDRISDFEEQVIKLNDRVNDTGKGLYHTEVEDENGGTILYTHDMPTLGESTYITMTTSAGFVFTSGTGCWNEGNPTWQYGYTDYGDMVMNTIAARKISTELLTIGSRNHETVVKNLVLNSSFDNGLEHWNHFTNSFQDDLGIWQYPFYSAEIVTPGDNKYLRLCPGDEYQYPHLDSDPIAVLPGKTYRVSFEVQCDIKALMPRVQADVYNSSDERMSYKVSPSIGSADNFAAFEVEAGKFTEHSFEITIPEAEDSYYVILRLFATKAFNGTLADNYFVRFDNVQLIGEMTEINGNIVITEDEISVYNGKITIYSDSSGGSPVFSANDDGTLKIVGELKIDGDNYTTLITNASKTFNDNSSMDIHGIFQISKTAIPTITDILEGDFPSVYFYCDSEKYQRTVVVAKDLMALYTTAKDGYIIATTKEFSCTGDISCGGVIKHSSNHLIGVDTSYNNNTVIGSYNQAGHTVIRTNYYGDTLGVIPGNSHDIALEFNPDDEDDRIVFSRGKADDVIAVKAASTKKIIFYIGDKAMMKIDSSDVYVSDYEDSSYWKAVGKSLSEI